MSQLECKNIFKQVKGPLWAQMQSFTQKKPLKCTEANFKYCKEIILNTNSYTGM